MTFVDVLLIAAGVFAGNILASFAEFIRDKLREDEGLPPRRPAPPADEIDGLERELLGIDGALGRLLDRRKDVLRRLESVHGLDVGAGAA